MGVRRIRKIFDIKVLRMVIARRDSHYDSNHHLVLGVQEACVVMVGEMRRPTYLLGDFTSSTRSSKEYFIGVVVETDEAWWCEA